MKTVVIIPARRKSTRFPNKPLVPLLGKPMILWVAELSAQAVGKERVFVATDDDTIAATVRDAGFHALMTGDALTGTDRLAEAAAQLDADIVINVQGDEPLVRPADILTVIEAKQRHPGDVINAYCRLGAQEDPASVNIPKVVVNESGRLLYMSRAQVPGTKDAANAPAAYHKQVCIYAFTRDELAAFRAFGRKSCVEHSEDIEILRFLELDKTIRMVELGGGSLAVDIPADVAPVEEALRARATGLS